MTDYRIDRATAERVIGAVHASRSASEPPTDAEPLLALLLAAAAPARPEEIAGESAAVAAFLAGRRAAVRPQPRTRLARIAAAAGRLRGVKAGIAGGIVVGGLAFGGVALASGTGMLPDSWPDPFHAADSGGSAHASARPAGAGSPGGSGRSGANGRGTKAGGSRSIATSESTGPDGSRSSAAGSSFFGICQAYSRSSDHAGVADNPQFQSLIIAAGGSDNVEQFCAAVISSGPGNAPDSPGNKPESPGNKPESPGNRQSAPGNKPEPPGNKPESPGNKPESPGNRQSAPGNKPTAHPTPPADAGKASSKAKP